MESPLLSIVIPTRDRPETAIPCIRQVLAIPDRDIEVVVRDCGDTNTLRDFAEPIEDSRFTYQRAVRCSMGDNWNAAYTLTTGKYVSYIGDDDGFLPSGVAIVRDLAMRKVGAIAYANYATYFWPNFPEAARAGKLFYSPTAIGAMPVISSRQSMLDRFRGTQARLLPAVYHGVVSRASLERVKQKVGAVFQSTAPDTFLSAVLCSLDISLAVLDAPLIVNGKSGKSNSGITATNANFSTHMNEYSVEEQRIEKLMPPGALSALVGDSYLKGLIAAGDDELIGAFASHYLGTIYAEATLRNPKLAVPIWRHYVSQVAGRHHTPLFARGVAREVSTLARAGLRRLIARGPYVRDPDAEVFASTDICMAVECIERVKAERGI